MYHLSFLFKLNFDSFKTIFLINFSAKNRNINASLASNLLVGEVSSFFMRIARIFPVVEDYFVSLRAFFFLKKKECL